MTKPVKTIRIKGLKAADLRPIRAMPVSNLVRGKIPEIMMPHLTLGQDLHFQNGAPKLLTDATAEAFVKFSVTSDQRVQLPNIARSLDPVRIAEEIAAQIKYPFIFFGASPAFAVPLIAASGLRLLSSTENRLPTDTFSPLEHSYQLTGTAAGRAISDRVTSDEIRPEAIKEIDNLLNQLRLMTRKKSALDTLIFVEIAHHIHTRLQSLKSSRPELVSNRLRILNRYTRRLVEKATTKDMTKLREFYNTLKNIWERISVLSKHSDRLAKHSEEFVRKLLTLTIGGSLLDEFLEFLDAVGPRDISKLRNFDDKTIALLLKIRNGGLLEVFGLGDIIEGSGKAPLTNNYLTTLAALSPYKDLLLELTSDQRRLLLYNNKGYMPLLRTVLQSRVLSNVDIQKAFEFIRAFESGDLETSFQVLKEAGVQKRKADAIRWRVQEWQNSWGDSKLQLLRLILTLASRINAEDMAEVLDLADNELSYIEAVRRVEQYTILKSLGTITGRIISKQDLNQLIDEDAAFAIQKSSEATIGVVSRNEAYLSLVNRLDLMKKWLGADWPTSVFFRFNVGPSVTIRFEPGKYGYDLEDICGFKFVLSFDGTELCTIGFQETNRYIQITHYQGKPLPDEEREKIISRFHQFSGGVDPIPWLAFAAGRYLLGRALETGKKLVSIRGKYVLWGYPHVRGDSHPPDVSSQKDAQNYWNMRHPKIEDLTSEYYHLKERHEQLQYELIQAEASNPEGLKDIEDELSWIARRMTELKQLVHTFRGGSTVEKLYDTAAQLLGFRSRNGKKWWTYTKDPGKFGRSIISRIQRNGSDSRIRFDESIRGFDRSILDIRVFQPFYLEEREVPLLQNPFLTDFPLPTQPILPPHPKGEAETVEFEKYVEWLFRRRLYDALKMELLNQPFINELNFYDFVVNFAKSAILLGRDWRELSAEMGRPLDFTAYREMSSSWLGRWRHSEEDYYDAVESRATSFVKWLREARLKRLNGMAVDRALPFVLEALLTDRSSISTEDLEDIYFNLRAMSKLSGVTLFQAKQMLEQHYSQWGKQIRRAVAKRHPVRFDQYFRMAMFDDQLGLYTAVDPDKVIGDHATFSTYGEYKVYAELMAIHSLKRWIELGRPGRFDIVEIGAGRGVFARNFLEYIRQRSRKEPRSDWARLEKAIRYKIVEISKVFVERQKAALTGLDVEIIHGSAVTFKLPEKVTGMFISNELLDMFPPRKFVYFEGQWFEAYITRAPHKSLTEAYYPLSGTENPEVFDYLEKTFPRPHRGETAYFQPDIKNWLANLAGQLERGWILTADYGRSTELKRRMIGFRTPTAPGSLMACSGRDDQPLRIIHGIKYLVSGEGMGETRRFYQVLGPLSLLFLKDFTVDVDFDWLTHLAPTMGLDTTEYSLQRQFFARFLKSPSDYVQPQPSSKTQIRSLVSEQKGDNSIILELEKK